MRDLKKENPLFLLGDFVNNHIKIIGKKTYRFDSHQLKKLLLLFHKSALVFPLYKNVKLVLQSPLTLYIVES